MLRDKAQWRNVGEWGQMCNTFTLMEIQILFDLIEKRTAEKWLPLHRNLHLTTEIERIVVVEVHAPRHVS